MTTIPHSSGKRIIVTGGSGKVGRHVIQYLLSQGHQVLNLDLLPLPPDLAIHVDTLITNLTESGQVFSALTSHFRLAEPFRDRIDKPVDAVIHMAAISRNMIVPDNETFRLNVQSTFNVVEAACKLGVRKIVLGSSVCVYGVAFAEGDIDYPSFPVDEEVDTNPMDPYGLSKLCGEKIGRSFARKFGVDIYALRIGRVMAPDEYGEWSKKYTKNPENWRVHGWSYTDARDLGKMCHLAVLKSGLGYQTFNATNDEITNDAEDTEEFLRAQCPNTPFTRKFGPREAPITNRKIKEMLGFEEDHNWRRYYPEGQFRFGQLIDRHIATRKYP